MGKYICTVCDFVYDPVVGDKGGGVAPDTSFENIPANWTCPVCGALKHNFKPAEG